MAAALRCRTGANRARFPLTAGLDYLLAPHLFVTLDTSRGAAHDGGH